MQFVNFSVTDPATIDESGALTLFITIAVEVTDRDRVASGAEQVVVSNGWMDSNTWRNLRATAPLDPALADVQFLLSMSGTHPGCEFVNFKFKKLVRCFAEDKIEKKYAVGQLES